MQGNLKESSARGVMPRALDLIFQHILEAPPEMEYAIKVSYMELYCEKVKDLLKPGNDNLKITETAEEGVSVPDASQGGCAGHDLSASNHVSLSSPSLHVVSVGLCVPSLRVIAR